MSKEKIEQIMKANHGMLVTPPSRTQTFFHRSASHTGTIPENLSTLTSTQLAAAIQSIPAPVTRINLTDGYLLPIQAHLQNLFQQTQAIPGTPAQLAAAFTFINRPVSNVDFSDVEDSNEDNSWEYRN